jgi:predicted nucleic acid-binding protein
VSVPAIAGIDTMVLIYAGIVPAKKTSKVAPDLSLRAKLLLHMLRDSIVILPAIAVSELLIPVPASKKGVLVAELQTKFLCPPFDLQAAAIASELWAKHKKLPKDSQYKQRQVLRADSMIIATCKASGATAFYSHDADCRALANLVMKGNDLPKDDPTDMFIKKDMERGDV